MTKSPKEIRQLVDELKSLKDVELDDPGKEIQNLVQQMDSADKLMNVIDKNATALLDQIDSLLSEISE